MSSLCDACLPVTPTTKSSCPDCLQVPSLYVSCMQSVEPGSSGQVDVAENVVDTPCSGNIYYELYDVPAFFSSGSINSSTGILDFTIDAGSTGGESGVIKGKAWCLTGDALVLSQFFSVTICAKESVPV